MVQTAIKAFAILALVVLHALQGSVGAVGFSSASAWHTHFVYMFFHATWLHLMINAWALCFAMRRKSLATLGRAYLAAVACSFACQSTVPTVGASGIVFYLVGHSYTRIKSIKSWGIIVAMLAAGFCRMGINAWLHLLCFALPLIGFEINKFKNDRRRVAERKQGEKR